MEAQIKEIDRLIAWGARMGKLTGKYLEGFQNVLRAILDQYTQLETSIIEKDVAIRNLIDRNDKLRLVCRLCGLSEKAIENISALDSRFLESYPNTVQSDTDYRVLMSDSRIIEARSQVDIGTLRHYRQVWQIALEKTENRLLTGILENMRELAPHLLQYFDRIENGEDPLELNVEEFLFEYYLYN
jgi:hypothetical protein